MARWTEGLFVVFATTACTPSAGSFGTIGEPARPSGILSAGQGSGGGMDDVPLTSGGEGMGTGGGSGPGADSADATMGGGTVGDPGDSDGQGEGPDQEGSTGSDAATGGGGEVPPPPPPPPPPQSLPEFGCENEGSLASQSYDDYVYLEMTNVSGEPRRLVWLDYEGDRDDLGQFGPGESIGIGSYVTHPLMITDANGDCLTIFVVEAGMHFIDVY